MTEGSGELRVVKVAVIGLFGLYDHTIELNQSERITILHGPNGVGKSALLRLVASFFNARYQEFVLTPFSEFSVELSDGQRFAVHRPLDSELEEVMTLQLEYSDRRMIVPQLYQLPVMFQPDKVAAQLERESPFLNRLSEALYYDYRLSQRLTSEEVVRRYGTASELHAAISIALESEPESLKAVRKSVSVQLVETQRLLRTPPENAFVQRQERRHMIATVRSYSDEIIQLINRTLSTYGTESQKLDQTFPQRLIGSSVSSLSVEQLKDRLGRLDEQQNSLNALGLIDKVSYPASPSEIDALDNVKRSVMALYVEDTERKLSVLSGLARRMELLLDSVNGKFRNKLLRISRERGMYIEDSRQRVVPLEALSSGEQHELVLWFDLLFKVNTNTLVLIDEPELSLHVTWQKRFLPELLTIASTVKFDALLATHSPYIIGDRLDLTVPLDADVDE